MKLFTVGNPKTAKGAAHGYLTAVLHLAPYKASGYNVCPMAELAGCHVACLNTAGRGGISKGSAKFSPHGISIPDNVIQRARIARTLYFTRDVEGFMRDLCAEIDGLQRRADRLGAKLAIRLNGTSDIRWESIPVGTLPNIFAAYPETQFYDYTKIPNRRIDGIQNYYLCLSYSEASERYAELIRESSVRDSRNLVAVFHGSIPATFKSIPVISGDEHDLRFLDPPGVVVGLKAKGLARRDASGFVIRP